MNFSNRVFHCPATFVNLRLFDTHVNCVNLTVVMDGLRKTKGDDGRGLLFCSRKGSPNSYFTNLIVSHSFLYETNRCLHHGMVDLFLSSDCICYTCGV